MKKAFFRRPTEREILNNANLKRVYQLSGLLKKLKESNDPVLIHFSLIPGYYYQEYTRPHEASREYLKRGELIKINHPETIQDCTDSKFPFYDFFIWSLTNTFNKTLCSENKSLGYRFQPNWGDRTRREVFFNDLLEGFLMYLYFREASPISIDDRYTGNERKTNIGAQVLVSVPSREKGQRRYRFKIINVPFNEKANNLSISLELRASTPNLEESSRPASEIYTIQYKERDQILSPMAIRFLPHDIAAYFAICEEQMKKNNSTPAFFSPFPFPSEELIEVYLILKNKTLCWDPFSEKDEKRFLYDTEISRAISLYLQTRERDLNKLFLRGFDIENYPFIKDEIQKNLEGESS